MHITECLLQKKERERENERNFAHKKRKTKETDAKTIKEQEMVMIKRSREN